MPYPNALSYQAGHSCSLKAALLLALPLFVIDHCSAMDLRDAVILHPPELERAESKAVQMLEEEVEKRTQVRWPEVNEWPPRGPVIAVGLASKLEQFAGPFISEFKSSSSSFQKESTSNRNAAARAPEGYRICVLSGHGRSAVFVIGNDSRGVLFGIGSLLRALHMARNSLILADQLDITTAPKYPVRGHQLGYRPKTNSYDAWDLPNWEQYYRDLAVFGCNTIELIPPRSDDAPDSPHFHRPQIDMMIGMSRLAEDYGLDVSVWYPAMEQDYSNPATVDSAILEWQEVFRKLPRLDVVFVPGGDPGHTRPKYLMALLEKQTQSLHRFHPKAQMWVSPQSFNKEWFDEFIELLKKDHPSWLSGVVFGPQVRVSLLQLRELIPQQYPIRNYPDITHSRQCQFAVPDWDVAYAVTEARECINPRPQDEAAIFHALQPFSIGFVTYSEGCNDDVNKCVWSALGWDPTTSVTQILQEYGRYFIGEIQGNDFAQGLMGLEQNWRGSLPTNSNVDATLSRFQALERAASPFDLRNWRFQQGLFRAYYDAYTRQRLIYETGLENEAMKALEQAAVVGSSNAMYTAQMLLDRAVTERVATPLRNRVFELAEALFQSIGMQLSVEKYKAIAVDRGACLDTLDYPLNNRNWLKEKFAAIRNRSLESEKLVAIREIIQWTNAGPGGFYDDLGNPARQPHLVREFSFAQDPGAMRSPRCDFEEDLVADEPDEKTEGARRLSWMDHAETLYDTPLELRYDGLDPGGRYRVRVVYAGDNPKRKARLMTGQGLEVHPLISKPVPFRPLEFPIPAEATRNGTLILKWFGEPGLGGNGRTCQVSEVWLLKNSPSASP